MEAGKKRKVPENSEVGKQISTAREGGGEKQSATPPTEDEVEEFFTILRRMHVAVKHFEKGDGAGGDGRKRWRVALETDLLEGVKGGGEKRGGKVEESRVFDLNAAPEGETNSA